MSKRFLVTYTSAICINALAPLLLHIILARQQTPTSIARWIRVAVLFDAFSDTVYGFLPLGYLINSFLYYYVAQREVLCPQAKSLGITCSLFRNSAIFHEASECVFGGRTPWAIFIKIKSRVLPLLVCPDQVLDGFEVRRQDGLAYYISCMRLYV